MIARPDGGIIIGVGRPLVAESDLPSFRPIEDMLMNRKQLEIEGACLLNTNRKPWSSDKVATSFLCGTSLAA